VTSSHIQWTNYRHACDIPGPCAKRRATAASKNEDASHLRSRESYDNDLRMLCDVRPEMGSPRDMCAEEFMTPRMVYEKAHITIPYPPPIQQAAPSQVARCHGGILPICRGRQHGSRSQTPHVHKAHARTRRLEEALREHAVTTRPCGSDNAEYDQ